MRRNPRVWSDLGLLDGEVMKIEVVRTFDALPNDASRLFSSAEKISFHFGLPWFQTFFHFLHQEQNNARVYVVANATGEQTLAVAPMYRANTTSMFSSNQLESMANYYSSLFSMLVDDTAIPLNQTLPALVQHFAAERPRWDVINLKPLDNTSALYHASIAAFKDSGFVVQEYFCSGNWVLDVNGRNFAEYFQSLPSQVRNTVQRKEKQLLKQENVQIRIVTNVEDVDAAMNDYETVYNSSWKQPEPHANFIREFMREAARRGWLRLGVVTIDGVPVAAQLWVVCHGIASIFKLAYDEKFNKLSAGSILTKTLMQHVIDVDRVHEVDYLTGDDSYKRDWMSHRRERWGIMAMNPRTLGGLLLIIRNVGGRWLKRFKKVTPRDQASP